MPRKKLLGPATPKQVLEYFDQADFGGVEVVFDLVVDIVKQRRSEAAGKPEVPAVGTTARKKRGKKRVEEAVYGDESLQDA